MNLWNNKTLEPPPTLTFIPLSNCTHLINLIKSSTELQDALTDNKYLHAEGAILSRCIYRMKVKLRSDKAMKSLSKVNRALLAYLNTDYAKTLNDFILMLPRKFNADRTRLPTRNIVDYTLVKTQGFAKLMSVVGDYASEAGRYLKDRIFIGHLWKMAFVAFAIVARIFILARHLTKTTCQFFDALLSGRESFLNTSNYQWLPADYVFPPKLNDWLNVDWMEIDLSTAVPINKSFVRFNDDNSDVEYCGEYIDINDDIEIIGEYFDITDKLKDDKTDKVAMDVLDSDEAQVIEIEDDDIGEIVEVKISKADFLDEINTLGQLELFVKEENIFRKAGSNHKYRLKGLDKLQWNMVRKSVKLLIKSAKSADANKTKKLLKKAKNILKLNLQ